MHQPVEWLPVILEAPVPAAIPKRCSDDDMDTSSIGSDSSAGRSRGKHHHQQQQHITKQQQEQEQHHLQPKQQQQQQDTKQRPDEPPQQQPKSLRLSAISKEQLEAHAAAYAAAAAAHMSLHSQAPHGYATTYSHTPSSCAAPEATTAPISRISSWISTLPDPESAPSVGPEPEQAPSVSSSNTVHSYEEAACAPSLARPSIWQSSVDSDVERQRLGCCGRLSFLGAI